MSLNIFDMHVVKPGVDLFLLLFKLIFFENDDRISAVTGHRNNIIIGKLLSKEPACLITLIVIPEAMHHTGVIPDLIFFCDASASVVSVFKEDVCKVIIVFGNDPVSPVPCGKIFRAIAAGTLIWLVSIHLR